MSRSQRPIARSADLSRRSFLASSSALAATADIAAACDRVLVACETWLTRHREHEGLSKRVEALEAFLVRHRHGRQLSHRQRAAFPQTVELDAIEDRRDALEALNEELLARIPAIAATTANGAIAKLAVAVACMPPEACEPAYNLIRSALKDLEWLASASIRPVHA